jgi:hypothetical protein
MKFIVYATTPGRKTLHPLYDIKTGYVQDVPHLVDQAAQGIIKNKVRVLSFPALPMHDNMWVIGYDNSNPDGEPKCYKRVQGELKWQPKGPW